ncbi:hypothetical protein Slin15195_G000290 [Septoria linicola]|uniref:Uncharacterized protein n=1 Tax=Septoria linicola TaxID=215465 RepID=A0A9Q9EDE8_9PEZI|nr:hypothetical protein Slin15195_G000290 [Septoria linicola]
MFSILSFASLALIASTVSGPEVHHRRTNPDLSTSRPYSAKGLGASAEPFKLVPWGAPDSAGTCLTTIIPNGLGCAIPVATTGAGTYQFAVETRQVFNNLTVTEARPFDNGTVLLSVEIRLGAREFIPAPATFHGYVYMDYSTECRIYAARAYADVLTFVFNQLVSIGVPNGGAGPVCKQLPVGGQKREAIDFVAGS